MNISPRTKWISVGAVTLLFVFTLAFCGEEEDEEGQDLNSPGASGGGDSPGVNQDVYLEVRKDQLWYHVDEESPFTGYAYTYYTDTNDTKMKTRTYIVDGVAEGIIDEWNLDGTKKGGGFAEDFKKNDE